MPAYIDNAEPSPAVESATPTSLEPTNLSMVHMSIIGSCSLLLSIALIVACFHLRITSRRRHEKDSDRRPDDHYMQHTTFSAHTDVAKFPKFSPACSLDGGGNLFQPNFVSDLHLPEAGSPRGNVDESFGARLQRFFTVPGSRSSRISDFVPCCRLRTSVEEGLLVVNGGQTPENVLSSSPLHDICVADSSTQLSIQSAKIIASPTHETPSRFQTKFFSNFRDKYGNFFASRQREKLSAQSASDAPRRVGTKTFRSAASYSRRVTASSPSSVISDLISRRRRRDRRSSEGPTDHGNSDPVAFTSDNHDKFLHSLESDSLRSVNFIQRSLSLDSDLAHESSPLDNLPSALTSQQFASHQLGDRRSDIAEFQAGDLGSSGLDSHQLSVSSARSAVLPPGAVIVGLALRVPSASGRSDMLSDSTEFATKNLSIDTTSSDSQTSDQISKPVSSALENSLFALIPPNPVHVYETSILDMPTDPGFLSTYDSPSDTIFPRVNDSLLGDALTPSLHLAASNTFFSDKPTDPGISDSPSERTLSLGDRSPLEKTRISSLPRAVSNTRPPDGSRSPQVDSGRCDSLDTEECVAEDCSMSVVGNCAF